MNIFAPVKKGLQWFVVRDGWLCQYPKKFKTIPPNPMNDNIVYEPILNLINVAFFEISPLGNLLAFIENGNTNIINIFDIKTNTRLSDSVECVPFSNSIIWRENEQGFFYVGKYEQTNCIYLYTLQGSAAARVPDISIFYNLDHPEWIYNMQMSVDLKFLFIYIKTVGEKNNMLLYKPVSTDAEIVFDANIYVIFYDWTCQITYLSTSNQTSLFITDYPFYPEETNTNFIVSINLVENLYKPFVDMQVLFKSDPTNPILSSTVCFKNSFIFIFTLQSTYIYTLNDYKYIKNITHDPVFAISGRPNDDYLFLHSHNSEKKLVTIYSLYRQNLSVSKWFFKFY